MESKPEGWDDEWDTLYLEGDNDKVNSVIYEMSYKDVLLMMPKKRLQNLSNAPKYEEKFFITLHFTTNVFVGGIIYDKKQSGILNT